MKSLKTVTIREIALLFVFIGCFLLMKQCQHQREEKIKNDYIEVRNQIIEENLKQQEELRNHYSLQIDSLRKDLKKKEIQVQIIYKKIDDGKNNIHRANDKQLDSMLRSAGL